MNKVTIFSSIAVQKVGRKKKKLGNTGIFLIKFKANIVSKLFSHWKLVIDFGNLIGLVCSK